MSTPLPAHLVPLARRARAVLEADGVSVPMAAQRDDRGVRWVHTDPDGWVREGLGQPCPDPSDVATVFVLADLVRRDGRHVPAALRAWLARTLERWTWGGAYASLETLAEGVVSALEGSQPRWFVRAARPEQVAHALLGDVYEGRALCIAPAFEPVEGPPVVAWAAAPPTTRRCRNCVRHLGEPRPQVAQEPRRA